MDNVQSAMYVPVFANVRQPLEAKHPQIDLYVSFITELATIDKLVIVSQLTRNAVKEKLNKETINGENSN